MQVVCIEHNNYFLTVDKKYEVIKEYSNAGGTFYEVIDDNGVKSGYFKNRFKTLSEVRINKLNKCK